MNELDQLFYEATIDDTSDKEASSFMESFNDFETLERMHDAKLLQLTAYIESAMSECQINIKRAELKCAKEGGTDDDLMFLEGAAEEGFIVKVRNTIRRLIEMFNNFMQELKLRVASKIASVRSKKALGAVEKELKLNPALGKEKVQIPDRSYQLTLINTYMKKNERLCARTVRGLIGTHDLKGFMQTVEEYREQFNHAFLADVGVVTISIAALVIKAKSDIDGLPKELQYIQNATSKSLEAMDLVFNDETMAYARAANLAVANFTEDMAHRKANLVTQIVYDGLQALEQWYMEKKGVHIMPIIPEKGPSDWEPEPQSKDYKEKMKKLIKRDPLYYGESGEDQENNELLEALDTFLESSGIYINED